MEYTCKCVPKQEYPHLVRSKSIKWYQKKGIPLALAIAKAPGKSCDNHQIPTKKYAIYLTCIKNWWEKPIRFGKMIY